MRPSRAAAVFASKPILWQSLAYAVGPLQGRVSRESLARAAFERLTTTPETDLTHSIAAVIGAAALAKGNSALLPHLSAKMAALHLPPEALANPGDPPRQPQLITKLGTFWTKARTANIAENDRRTAAYQTALGEHQSAVTRYNERNDQINSYHSVEHPDIQRNGGMMIGEVVKWETNENRLHDRIFHSRTRGDYGMEHIVNAVLAPAGLRPFYDRLSKQRSRDHYQVPYELVVTALKAMRDSVRSAPGR